MMRWLDREARRFRMEGNERIVSRFLWWPTYAGDEWRWLERARIRQYYCPYWGWDNLEFIDKDRVT